MVILAWIRVWIFFIFSFHLIFKICNCFEEELNQQIFSQIAVNLSFGLDRSTINMANLCDECEQEDLLERDEQNCVVSKWKLTKKIHKKELGLFKTKNKKTSSECDNLYGFHA